MKICFICPEYPEGPHGGIGSMVQILSRELVKLGHEVRVIGIYPKSYPAPDYEEDQGVQVWRLRELKGKFGWIIPYIKQYKLIKKWVQTGHIDIVEAPDSRGWFAYWPKLTIPIILRANGSNGYFSKVLKTKINKVTFLLEKKSYLRADGILSASKFTAIITKKVFNPTKDFVIIYNGIEIPVIDDSIPRLKNTIVFSGSLNRKKGILQLIQAILLLVNSHPKLRLEIYGKNTYDEEWGSVQEYLKTLIPDKWRENIDFKGHISRDALMKVFWSASVAVFPSFAEAFAHAPMESMVCRCPTIYTILGSGEELIKNGIDGLLVDPMNPNEIASAILKIIENPDLASKIGENGRKKILEKFSFNSMVTESIDYYKQTINDFKHGKKS